MSIALRRKTVLKPTHHGQGRKRCRKDIDMILKVMSWNMAGAKVFGCLDGDPDPVAKTYIKHFYEAWEQGVLRQFQTSKHQPDYPDIILLQECIGFVDHRATPSGRWQTGKQILEGVFSSSYECFFFPAFSSHTHPHPARWNQLWQGGGTTHYIPEEIEAQQGYGVCVRRDPAPLRRLWVKDPQPDTTKDPIDRPNPLQYNLCFEAIHTATGLYLGGRDTEPRLVVLGRLKVPDGPGGERYVNFLDVHLTTLKGEREGKIRLDRQGSRIRLQQLEMILDNIISAYQEATQHRMPRTAPHQKEDIWVMAGDFNATPVSEELELVGQAGFVDGNPDKHLEDAEGTFDGQIGTKWSIRRDPGAPGGPPFINKYIGPPIVVDYVLCGLQSSAFSVNGVSMARSRRPYRPPFPQGSPFEPDHAVLFASLDVK